MRKRKYSLFERWWDDLDFWSVSRYVLLPITGPVWIAKLVLYGILGLMILFEYIAFPGAVRKVIRSYRKAIALGQTDQDATQLKGGGHRKEGKNRKGFLIRPGGSLNSDDLRRRLYELRRLEKERKHQHAPNKGGHYGEQ